MKQPPFYNPPRYIFRKKLIQNLLSHEKSLETKTSLEIGYGAGDLLITCAKKGLQVYGYDFSEAAEKQASERIKASGEKNITLCHSLQEFSDKKFDYLFTCEVLEHIEDDRNELLKWNFYLKNGGVLIMSVPSRMKKWGANDEVTGHFRRYEKKQLLLLLKEANFQVEVIWSYPFPMNLILDKMLHSAAKSMSKQDKDLKNAKDKYTKTKYSGIKRKTNALYKLLSNEYLLDPLHWLQKLFLHTDLGSGYLLKAKKIKG